MPLKRPQTPQNGPKCPKMSQNTPETLQNAPKRLSPFPSRLPLSALQLSPGSPSEPRWVSGAAPAVAVTPLMFPQGRDMFLRRAARSPCPRWAVAPPPTASARWMRCGRSPYRAVVLDASGVLLPAPHRTATGACSHFSSSLLVPVRVGKIHFTRRWRSALQRVRCWRSCRGCGGHRSLCSVPDCAIRSARTGSSWQLC